MHKGPYDTFVNVNAKFESHERSFQRNTTNDELSAARHILRSLGNRNIDAKGIEQHQKGLLLERYMIDSLNHAIFYTLYYDKDPPASMTLGDQGNIYEGLRDALVEAGFSLGEDDALRTTMPKLTLKDLNNIVKDWSDSRTRKFFKSAPSEATTNAIKKGRHAHNDFTRFSILNEYYQDPSNEHRSFRKALDNSSDFINVKKDVEMQTMPSSKQSNP